MSIPKIQHYIGGKWLEGDGEGEILLNAINGTPVGRHSIVGLDFKDILDYGRNVGGPSLRDMTFYERGLMLKNLALHLTEVKERFYSLSWATGATRVDSWIDIEGGIGNLFAYASLRRHFGSEKHYVDGDMVGLSKGGTFVGTHIMVPKAGVAIHINAFNFPVWGMLEKAAVNWLAGVPAVIKPAEQTCYLTELVVKEIVASGIVPEGAIQLVAGYGNGIIDHVTNQDIVTFTGSFATGVKLKTHPQVIAESVPFNLEADSLNAAILGEDALPGTAEFDLFIKEVRKEMTVKCGQKCTAVRRIIVPEALVEDVQINLGKALAKTTIGDPQSEGVKMGALAGKEQLAEVMSRVAELRQVSELVFGDPENVDLIGADSNEGAFMSPLLFVNNDPFNSHAVHNTEAFGPVSTIIPYKNTDEAIELSKMGKGSLCSSIATNDDKTARDFVIGAATHHGRILVLNRDSAKESTGHGSPMPMLSHGGPGRAGGGEEMGGARGVLHYLQRCAIQGTPTTLTEITNQYQYGGKYKESASHLFSKFFEELEVGQTIITHKRTVTDSDIVNFANVSWDHFYAHTDETSLEGTTFDRTVAHGYFVLSAAAGLFVQAKKGPVLLNYGLEDCRFTKPVYPGMTIGVRLTVKEKVDQEKKDDIAKGIVKFLVDVFDETDETVAIATILTMVKKKNQD